MNSTRALHAMQYLINYLDENGFGKTRCSRTSKYLPDTHRLQEARAVLDDLREDIEKDRQGQFWLRMGFVQGILFAVSMMTIEELDSLLRPDFFICARHGGSEQRCCHNSIPPSSGRKAPPLPVVPRDGF